ncbi:TonB-dependent receptor plug domain-containing protein [Polaribacter uvawellassae]|uniref:TonB-dependent receptor plug domain-containing protein n=1 Tax=Polaribacter uvawellassae TaxID=3133495 RepID=UPI003219D52E
MNIKKHIIVAVVLLLTSYTFAQEKTVQLDTVVISSSRIDLPFKQNSRTILVITAKQIKESAVTNIADLLQQVAGVDVRRRGVSGMQSDLYIRGGSFDQTLLLIDGIKVEDPQTGHHTMNMALPLDVIERVEIIKGAAARIFGQNAFTGAINIVTKKDASNVNSVGVQAGSFGQKNAAITVGKNLDNSSIIVHASLNSSDGYRHNTDFKNQNYFIKNTFNKNNTPIDFIGYFTERNFGANGFYASPSAINQYEETQSSLVGLSTTIKNNKLTLKPRFYWKRNQDMYLYTRSNPAGYRNLHISNKIGAELNASYNSSAGITGFGIDVAKVFLTSNNLGSRDRFMANLFLEHRFKLFNDKMDITPGVAINYFSDFKFHAFPGVDVGYTISDNFKVYANAGYTYRIPTYTDLFYSDPTTLGNANLNPEEAISEELGIKYTSSKFDFSTAVFNRDSNNLIDYVKANANDKWQATNIQDLNSFGVEFNGSFRYKVKDFTQNLSFGYTYLDENLEAVSAAFSRYSINSLKHHFTTTFRSQFFKNVSQSVVYKFSERSTGESYGIVDLMLTLNLNRFDVSLIGNNIFDTVYTETNLVPMPKANFLIDINYKF